MTFNVGDKVSITKNHEDLPYPQYLYAGATGTVTNVLTAFVYVKPDTLLSGDDGSSGVPFYFNELSIISKQATQPVG